MTTPVTPAVYSATPPSIFGREPALLLGLTSGVIAVISSSIPALGIDNTEQGYINATVAAVLGLIVAFKVKGGTWAAALLALVQTVIALLLAFKFDLNADLQSGVLFLTSAIGAYATRQVVDALPPAEPGSSPVA